MNTARHQVYHCRICGNVVQVVCAAAGQLVCCSRPMDLQVEQEAGPADAHRLQTTLAEGRLHVSLPSFHPMRADHYIHWIEVILRGRAVRQWLDPGEPPQATFAVDPAAVLGVRAYCTEHGLYRA